MNKLEKILYEFHTYFNGIEDEMILKRFLTAKIETVVIDCCVQQINKVPIIDILESYGISNIDYATVTEKSQQAK